MDRNETISRIGAGLKRRSGKKWSVTGGKGTAYGWITVDAPPSRRTWSERPRPGVNPNDMTLSHRQRWEPYDTGTPGHSTGPGDLAELARLFAREEIHHQGLSIPANSDYYEEYVARAEGLQPAVTGKPYWD